MLHRISLVFLLLFSLSAWATDNSIKMGYNFVTVSQNVVFNSSMQSGGTLSFSAQVADGGGRAPGDPFTMKLVFYNSSNQIVNTVQQSWTLTLGAAASTYTLNATNCGSSCSTVAYVSVQFYGKDGGYWAGNYGPYIVSPSLTFNSGSNILYNPQFGIYTGTAAQGWTSSNGWQSCALYSGTNTCVTNNGASVNGGNYDANGGTTSGTAGGYAVIPTSPTTTGTSSGITNTQQTRKNNLITNRNSVSGNSIYIDQAGSNNTFNITQTNNNNSLQGINQQRALLKGDSNTVTVNQGNSSDTVGKNLIKLEMNTGSNSNMIKLYQGYNTDGSMNIYDSDGHIISLGLTGSTNQINLYQTNLGGNNAGHFAELNVNGNTNNITVTQSGNGGKTFFSTVTGNSNTISAAQDGLGSDYLDITLTGNGHTVNANQSGTGNHLGTINLTNGGGASTVNLTQSGSTAQSYSITQTCVNPAGCSVSVTQP